MGSVIPIGDESDSTPFSDRAAFRVLLQQASGNHDPVVVLVAKQTEMPRMQSLGSQAGLVRAATVATDLISGSLVLDTIAAADPDLLLVHLGSPPTEGLVILRALLSSIGEHVPIVAIGPDPSGQAEERSLEAGARDFILEPCEPAELTLRLRNQLIHSVTYRQLVTRQQELETFRQVELARDRSEARRSSAFRKALEEALTGEGLRIHFQPIIDLTDGRVVGVEALARFSPKLGAGPETVFAQAARLGLGLELQERALTDALAALGRLPPDVYLSVNISPEALVSPSVVERLLAADRGRVVVELTVRAKIDDYGTLSEVIARLHGAGLRVAIDDAGAGFSGLKHLIELQPEIIKLDLTLTAGIDRDPLRQALSTSLVRFAETVSASLVAKGVSNRDELETLRRLKVPCGQGFGLARPGRLGDVMDLDSDLVRAHW